MSANGIFARALAVLALAGVLGFTMAASPASPSTLVAIKSEAELQERIATLKAARDARYAAQEAEFERRRQAIAAGTEKPVPAYGHPMPTPTLVKGPGWDSNFGSPYDGASAEPNSGEQYPLGFAKRVGDFLVVLRRGRLFSIRVDDKAMQAVSSVEALGPGLGGANTSFGGMLVSGNTIVVISDDFPRSGTEIGRFRLSKDGHIQYRDTWELYHDTSLANYSAGIFGNTLVFTGSLDLLSTGDGGGPLPAFRRLDAAAKTPYQRIVPAERIYMAANVEPVDSTLHTITRCEILEDSLDCHSTSVLGPEEAYLYVSPSAAYAWMLASDKVNASVARIPADGSAPTSLRVQGDPMAELFFLEKDGHLNVRVGAEDKGLNMWAPGREGYSTALFRVPVSEFGGADASARPDEFRLLPGPADDSLTQNLYVGNWLVYGGGEDASETYALRIDRRDPPTRLRPTQAVDRIVPMGSDALLVGQSGWDLYFSGVRLDDTPKVASELVISGADVNTSWFRPFYQRLGDREGLLAFAIPENDSASVQFVHNTNQRLSVAGKLETKAKPEAGWMDDDCVAVCYAWYSDSRPIFLGDRVYSLLGYELLEGRLENGRIHETRRVDIRPPATTDSGK
jgi:hypothetical protein